MNFETFPSVHLDCCGTGRWSWRAAGAEEKDVQDQTGSTRWKLPTGAILESAHRCKLFELLAYCILHIAYKCKLFRLDISPQHQFATEKFLGA